MGGKEGERGGDRMGGKEREREREICVYTKSDMVFSGAPPHNNQTSWIEAEKPEDSQE